MADFNAIAQSIWAWFLSFINRLIPDYIIPNLRLIVEVVILLIAGYIVGRIVKVIMVRLLNVVGLRKITSRTWAESLLKATGYRGTVVELISDLVKWLVYIMFLALIIQTLGLPGVADIFTQIAVFMPRFIGAIVIVVIGFMIADFFGKIFEEAGRRFLEEETLARLSGGMIKYSVALIAVIMALSLLGLDTASLTIMVTIIMGTMIALLIIGVKDIFPNFSAGLHLRHDLKAGDHVKIGDHSGVVEKVDTMSVYLRNGEKRVTIPNSVVMTLPIERKLKK
jgi:small-conductance mechanosensitive channel